jgi:transposase
MTRIGKGKVMQDTVGKDVSKATLDAYWLSGRQHQVFSNDQAGLKRLLRWICKAKAGLTVFEATGVYDRLLQAQLAAHGMPFSRVNPKQARRFAEGIGQLAKTDKVSSRACGAYPARQWMPSFWHGWDRFLTSKLSNREPMVRMFLKTWLRLGRL